MTTLNIRVENSLKAKAGKTLSAVGLDMSSAVRSFLYQVVLEKGLPFTPTKNISTIKARWDNELKETLRSGKSYKNAKELLADIK